MDGREGRPPPPNPAMPYREDCWSEGATAALIDAWGDRYVELNRGNLRQKDWQEVADSVNSRRGGARRPPRTDSQCKNRIDTLKKKYKVERSRVSDSSGSVSSQWPFFSQLATLIGASGTPSSVRGGGKRTPPSISSPPLALPLPFHRKASPLPLPAARPVVPSAREKRPVTTALPVNDSFFPRNYSAAAAAAAAVADADSASSASSSRERSMSSMERPRAVKPVKHRRENRDEEGGVEVGIRQLAQAIVRFAETYEKVEAEKQRQMMELEKQRMDFAKGLEFQKMQAFVDTQVQIERIKRARRGDADDYL